MVYRPWSINGDKHTYGLTVAYCGLSYMIYGLSYRLWAIHYQLTKQTLIHLIKFGNRDYFNVKLCQINTFNGIFGYHNFFKA